MKTVSYFYKSPVGAIEIIYDDNVIYSLNFKEGLETEITDNMILRQCKIQLDEYFEGKRQRFDLPLSITGTDFQEKVWNALLDIPYATTITYKELALRLGDVKAIRAVAHTNGLNKFMIILPCHRVIGTDGKLVGYAGGLKRKKWLLEHENKFLPSGQTKLEF
jgi:methylated-DNA-[protein]-cysteine S-methyltransferase